MSRKLVLQLVVALGAVMLIAVTGVQAKADKGTKVDVVYTSLLPGGHELQAGVYNVHMAENGKAVQFVQKGKVVVQIPCHCIQNANKNERTEVLFNKAKGDKHTIQEMRLKGDTKTIQFEYQSGM